MKLKLRNVATMLKGHYTSAEHIGDVEIPGAHGISFKDADTLYISSVMGHNKPTKGGVAMCTMDLETTNLFSTDCSYYAVASGLDGTVVVRNGTGNTMEFYSQEPTKVLSIDLPAGKHKGMVVNSQGQVYVCDADSDSIRVYEASGELSRVIKHKEIRRPQYIALTRKGFVVTCMGDEPTMLHVDEEGEVLWEYDDLEFPAGVAVDDNNDVYVCDAEEGKISMITGDGELSFDLIPEHMLKYKKPFSIAVCGNKLAVQLLESDTIKLFQLTS